METDKSIREELEVKETELSNSCEKHYRILGKRIKMKPVKLQLHKDSHLFLQRLIRHVKETTGLSTEEMKNEDNNYLISLCVLGFLSNAKNLAEMFTIMLDCTEDWNKLIEENRNIVEELRDTGAQILSDFFLRIIKLTLMPKN